METGCHSLHRLKHGAVITLVIVFSLLFYITCMQIHYYQRTLAIIGVLKDVNQEIQQKALSNFFNGSLYIENGKYVLMKNGYQFSGKYFLFFDFFTINISIGYLIIMILAFYIYNRYIKKKTKSIESELDYLKIEVEHFLFGTKISRNDNYKECNYLLDRLEQKVHDMSILNKNELNRMINLHQNIIHQINTPLNTIKILIEYLYSEGKIDKNYLDNMNYAIEKASDLAYIYLRTSKLDTGRVKYHFEQIELFDMIEEVFYSLKIYADYYHIILVNKCDDSIIYADEVWIKEAIKNIVKNFIENAGEDNKIIITSKTCNELTMIYIDDNRKPYTSIENINFERFESSQHGIGIGLHLCRQIVETHLGEINVQHSPIFGLRFVIKLTNRPQKIKMKLEE